MMWGGISAERNGFPTVPSGDRAFADNAGSCSIDTAPWFRDDLTGGSFVNSETPIRFLTEQDRRHFQVSKGQRAWKDEDFQEAARWFALANERGDPVGTYELAWCYLCGMGVPENVDEGIRLLKTFTNHSVGDIGDIIGWLTNLTHESKDKKNLDRFWAHINWRFFAGRLTRPFIVIDELYCAGLFLTFGKPKSFIIINEKIVSTLGIPIRVCEFNNTTSSKNFLKGSKRIIFDLLLHETLHQYIYEHNSSDWIEDLHKGHGPKFTNECNRVGGQMGLPPVNVSEYPSCNNWPFNVRPLDYYLDVCGDWKPVEQSIIEHLMKYMISYGPDGPNDWDPVLTAMRVPRISYQEAA